MKKLIFILIIISVTIHANEIKESLKAKTARVTYEKSIKKAELLIIKAKVKYAKDLKLAIKAAAIKSNMVEANRLQIIIDKLNIPKKMGTRKLITIDEHDGVTGFTNINNKYILNVKDVRKTAKLVIECSGAGSQKTYGNIMMNNKQIGKWTDKEATSKRIIINVSQNIIKKGQYIILFNWTSGESGFNINKVTLIQK